MNDKVLPGLYQQVEYLQTTTVTSAVNYNTEFNIGDSAKLIWQLSWSYQGSFSSAYTHFCGWYYTASTRYTPYYSHGDHSLWIALGANGGDISFYNSAIELNKKYIFGMNKLTSKMFDEDYQYLGGETAAGSSTLDYPFYLFGSSLASTEADYRVADLQSIYHFYMTNGIQTIDLYPCIKKDTNIYGFYDLHNKSFKQVNSTYFIAGKAINKKINIIV